MKTRCFLLAAALLWACDGSGKADGSSDGDADDTGTDTGGDTTGDDPGMEPIYGECTTDEECEDAGPCGDGYCDLHSLICMARPPDADMDGYPAMEVEGVTCDGGTDCDDANPGIRPGATDYTCNWVDEDCDGIWDYMDDDGDGYGDSACGEDDCDDDDPAAFPGSAESCDDVDNDCDGDLLDAAGADDDGDTVLDEACGGEDCDDEDAAMNPAAPDVCDGIDNDCDGTIDSSATLTAGTPISGSLSSSPSGPVMTWSGSEFGFAWMDSSDGLSEVYFRRAVPGAALGAPLLVTTDGARASTLAIAWSGSEYGIAWEDTRLARPDIYFARVSAGGMITGPQARMTITLQDSRRPDLAWSGSEWGVAWTESTSGTDAEEVYFVRISASGSKVGTEVQVTSGAVGYDLQPRLAWSGSAYAASWIDDRDGGAGRVYFGLISPGGALLVETGVSDAADAIGRNAPGIAWSGSEFAIAWGSANADPLAADVSLARISTTGDLVAAPTAVVAGTYDTYERVFLEWTESGYQILWWGGPSILYLAEVGPDGTPPAAPTIVDASPGGTDVHPEAVEWNGTSLGLARTSWDPMPVPGIILHMIDECD